MKDVKLINKTGIPTTDYVQGRKGVYNGVVRVQAGFMTIVKNLQESSPLFHPSQILTRFKKGSLQTIEFVPDGWEHGLTVFARKGNKIITIDVELMKGIDIGCINQLFYNTNLYNQDQYKSVNGKTWADKAFVMNV